MHIYEIEKIDALAALNVLKIMDYGYLAIYVCHLNIKNPFPSKSLKKDSHHRTKLTANKKRTAEQA